MMIDTIVIVTNVGDLAEITTRNNKKVRSRRINAVLASLDSWGLQTQKRDLVVVDSSKVQTRLTLWGKQAEQFSAPAQHVIAFKGVRVTDFNGKWLSRLANISNYALHQAGHCPFSALGLWLLALISQMLTL